MSGHLARLLLTGAFIAGLASSCTLFGPCPAGDADCHAAVEFTGAQYPDRSPVAVVDAPCDPFLDNRGGMVAERCWRIELAADDPRDPPRIEAFVVLTTDDGVVLFSDAVLLDGP